MKQQVLTKAYQIAPPLIGADPELFLYSSKTKAFISGHEAIPGTKADPFPVKQGAVQVDGVACEFNIRPANNLRDFCSNLDTVMGVMNLMVTKSMGGDVVTVATPTALFDQAYFDSLPEGVKLLGCDPDYNAWWDGKPNPKPRTFKPMRTGSGHIHIGWTKGKERRDPGHMFDCIEMVKQMDAALFVPSLLWDEDHERRELYGKLGAFRPKPYGVEYRVLSNRWVGSRRLQVFVFDTAVHAYRLLEAGYRLYKHPVLAEIMHKDPKKITKIEQSKYLTLLGRKGFLGVSKGSWGL